jgi:ATP-dependent helicase/nuclease subunit A
LRLREEGLLTAEEVAALDLEGLAAFWQSGLGKRILARPRSIHREIPFTARFLRGDLEACGLSARLASDEFVVVQGVVDLAVIEAEAGEIWVVDFKTDELKGSGAAERAKEYEPQLKLYARALAGIYGRPVTECCLYFLRHRTAVSVAP